MEFKTEELRKKLMILLKNMNADVRMKKKLEDLSTEELDKIQKNAMQLLPKYMNKKNGHTGGRRKKTRRNRKKKKKKTRKKRGGLTFTGLGGGIGLAADFLVLGCGLFFFNYFSEWVYESFRDHDAEARDAYHRRQRARHRRGQDLYRYAQDELALPSDTTALAQYDSDAASAAAAARGHWEIARQFASTIPVLPGGSVYEGARARYGDGGMDGTGGGGGN